MVTKAKREATDRYDEKTYRVVVFRFRKEDDAEMIKDLDEASANGINHREWLKAIYEVYKANK